MTRFWTLIKQDLLVAYRNWYVAAILLTLGIMLALVWLLPDEFNVAPAELVADVSEGQVIQTTLLTLGADPAQFYADRAALETELRARKSGVGILVEGRPDDLRYTFITQGRFAAENLNLLAAVLDGVAAHAAGAPLPENLAINLLRERSEPVPARLAGIPIFLVFEVVALGFFLVAAMIFQEKQEGVIRALRVSPTGTLGYVLSKTAVFLILSLAYALLLLLLSIGLDVDYPRLLLLVALSSTMMTMAGIAVAVFFNNISEWFFAGTFVLLIFILPSVSYAIPSFAPAVLSWIPSYPVVFGIRELLFPTGKAGFLLNTTGLLIIYNLLALALAYWAVQKKLMQA